MFRTVGSACSSAAPGRACETVSAETVSVEEHRDRLLGGVGHNDDLRTVSSLACAEASRGALEGVDSTGGIVARAPGRGVAVSSKEVGGGPAAVVALVAPGMSAAGVTSCVGGCIVVAMTGDHLVTRLMLAVCPRMNTGANLRSSGCILMLTATAVDGGAG